MRYILGESPGTTINSATTMYYLIRNSGLNNMSTENNIQASTTVAGTFSQLYHRVSSNTLDAGTTVIKSRKNTADGNLTVSFGFGVTGDFTDLSNSDSIVATDVYNFQMVTSGTTGAVQIDAAIMFVPASGLTEVEVAMVGSMAGTTASTTYFGPLNGLGVTTNTVESDCQVTVKDAVTVKNLRIYISVNTRGTTSTFVSRKNTANGNLSISIGAGVTGMLSDLVNTDSLVAGDLYCWGKTNGTGAGALTPVFAQSHLVYTSSIYDSFSTSTAIGGVTRAASGTPSYVAPFGTTFGTFNATENNRKQAVPSAVTLSKFSLNVTANTYSVSATGNVRKTGANGNGNVTITNAVTGVFEDVTNSDSFIAGDFLSYGVTGGTSGSITVTWFGAKLQDTYPVVGNGDVPSLIVRQAVNRASTY